MASNEEMSSETEGEASQSVDQDQRLDHIQDQEDQGQDLNQGQEDPGQGSAQDEDSNEEQRGIQDAVQSEDGQDPAEEMLVGLLPNMAEDQI